MDTTSIREPPKTNAPFSRWTPWVDVDKPAHTYLTQGQVPVSYMVGWKYPIHPDTLLRLDGP